MGIKVSEADRQFSLAVRARAGYRCEYSGEVGCKMECAHLIGRRGASTRWDALNAVCLSHSSHRHFTENPKQFSDWIESKWPGRWEILYEKTRVIVKNNAATRKEVSAHYREQNKLLERDPDHKLVSWI